MKIGRLFGVVAASLLCACGSDDADAGTAQDGVSTCPTVSDHECPAGCNEEHGYRYDPVRKCRMQMATIVACSKASAAQDRDSISLCFVRSDGVAFIGGDMPGVPPQAFSSCGAEIFNSPGCP